MSSVTNFVEQINLQAWGYAANMAKNSPNQARIILVIPVVIGTIVRDLLVNPAKCIEEICRIPEGKSHIFWAVGYAGLSILSPLTALIDMVVSVAKFLYDPKNYAQYCIGIGRPDIHQLFSNVRTAEEQAEFERNKAAEKIEYNNCVNEFHLEKGISTGLESIQPEISALGLDLSEEQLIRGVVENSETGEYAIGMKTVAMREVVEEVLKEINGQFQGKNNLLVRTNTQEITPLKLRCIQIMDGQSPFNEYGQLGNPERKYLSEEREKQLWVPRVLQALVDHGHIFDFKVNNYGYLVQA